jgi:hypothetical protein
VGDFTGDGKLDLAVADSTFDTVSIWLGKGDGTFQAAKRYAVGYDPMSVTVGDFTGDGKLDLAVAGFSRIHPDLEGTVSVLLGNGDGTFQAAGNYAVDYHPTSVAVGDFTGHGQRDLAVAGFSKTYPDFKGTVTILLGNGDGTFQAAANYTVDNDPASVAVGDFTGHGQRDLAVVGPTVTGTGAVSILLGNGDGTFRAAGNYAAGNYPTAMAVGDFTGHGPRDLAVANINYSLGNGPVGSVSILLGNGDGTFQPAASYPVVSSPNSVAVGDFTGDGHLDIAVGGNGLSILSSKGDGTFQAARSNSLGGGVAVYSMTVGDFNNDGHPDIALLPNGKGTLLVNEPPFNQPPSDDGFGHTLSTATPLQLDKNGSVSIMGNTEGSFSVDAFRFVAPSTGLLKINVQSPRLEMNELTVFDSSQNPIPSENENTNNFFFPPQLPTELTIKMIAGQTYYVQVGSASNRSLLPINTGNYELTITTIIDDGVGHTFATATPLQLSSAGVTFVEAFTFGAGTILPGIMDFFRFVAPFTGLVSITIYQSTTLESSLIVYDTSHKQIGQVADVPSMPGFFFNTPVYYGVQFSAIAGQTYYVGVRASQYATTNNQFGDYRFGIFEFKSQPGGLLPAVIVPVGPSQSQPFPAVPILATQAISSPAVPVNISSGSSTPQSSASGSSGAESELPVIDLALPSSPDINLQEILPLNATNFAFGLETLLAGNREQVAELLLQKESSFAPLVTLVPGTKIGSSTGRSGNSGDRSSLSTFLIGFDPPASNGRQTASEPQQPIRTASGPIDPEPQHHQRPNDPPQLLDLLIPKPADQDDELPARGENRPKALRNGRTQSSSGLRNHTDSLFATSDPKETNKLIQLHSALIALAALQALWAAPAPEGRDGPWRPRAGRNQS